MIDIQSIADLELLRESVDLECKLAAGRDGKGAVPEDFWPTYSAFANTEGGIAILGVREKQGHFDVAGIVNVAKVRKDLFDGLNNRQKVSVNPGLMRIPVEVALQGGEPDCRNRTLHKMFRFVGVGEQAGTGIPKILHGWQSQHWNPPKLYDTSTPYNQTLLELRMIDLFPEQVMAGLKAKYGVHFEGLNYVERVALALAASEGTVNHARLRAVTTEHPVDLSKTLQHLTQTGMLESTGGRGAIYHLPGEAIPTPEDVFGPPARISIPSSPNLVSSSPNLKEMRDADGCLVSEQLALPVIDDLSALSLHLRSALESQAAKPRTKGKVDREVLIKVILQICTDRFVTLRCLAELVQRKPETLRDQYLTKLVRERKLTLAFPTTPTHERQAYSSTAVPPA